MLPTTQMTSRIAGVALAALAAVACSCSSGSSGSGPSATGTIAATASAREGWATPVILPVTPVAVPEHTIVDPKFEALPGARALFGTDGSVPGQAHAYQIEVPDDWNGDVVYFAHGFRGNGTELTVNVPPIREFLIAQGYAWAASSYAQNGYRPAIGARDTNRLRAVFEQLVDPPERSYLYGQSMGGNVITVSLESPETSTAYDGALSECGAMIGTGIVDYFLSWGALAGYLTGNELTNAATDVGAFADTLANRVRPALGSPDTPTTAGQAFRSAIENLTGGPRPLFDEGFAASYNNNFLVLFGAVVAPSPANAVAQNANTVYEVAAGLGVTNDDLNREIARARSNKDFQDRELYPEFAPSTGDIERPLLTIHGTGDLFVPIHLEQQYRQLVEDAGAGELLVQRAIQSEGHCNFTAEERERAFTDLVAWVESGTKPAGEELRGDLTNAGAQFTMPAR